MEFLARAFLAKLRFFGVVSNLDDLVLDDPELVCFAAKTGLSIIESSLNPADSYFLEHVSFPRFVRRYGFDCYIPAGHDIFRESVRFLSFRFPQFYYNCIAWPASIR